jgi:hypothetical protein
MFDKHNSRTCLTIFFIDQSIPSPSLPVHYELLAHASSRDTTSAVSSRKQLHLALLGWNSTNHGPVAVSTPSMVTHITLRAR